MGVNDRAFLRPRISQSQTLRGFLFCWGINNSNKLPNDEAIEAGAWNRRETKILQGEGSGTRLSAIIITVSLFIRSNRDTVICRARISKCSQGSLNYTRPMNLSWEFNWWKNTRAYIYIYIYILETDSDQRDHWRLKDDARFRKNHFRVSYSFLQVNFVFLFEQICYVYWIILKLKHRLLQRKEIRKSSFFDENNHFWFFPLTIHFYDSSWISSVTVWTVHVSRMANAIQRCREGEKETITILTTYVAILDCIGIRPRVFDIAKRRSMLRRFLSCRSRPIQSALIRENILNSNGDREKKGSFFFLRSSKQTNISKLLINRSSAKTDARNELDCESVTMHKHP